MADLKEIEKKQEGAHTLSLRSRSHAELSGVTEVNSFDETCVVLSTVSGELTVEGEELVIDGKVHALYYTETRQRKKGLFGGGWR